MSESVASPAEKVERGIILHLLVGVFAILVAWPLLTLFLWGVRDVYFGVASLYWPSTAGEIVGSNTNLQYEFSTEKGTGRRTSTVRWLTIVRYRYVVDEQKYDSYEIAFNVNNMNRLDWDSPNVRHTDSKATDTYLAQYPVGQEVVVYYNVHNPQNAVLRRGIHWQALAYAGIGSIWVLSALGWVRTKLRSRKLAHFEEAR